MEITGPGEPERQSLTFTLGKRTDGWTVVFGCPPDCGCGIRTEVSGFGDREAAESFGARTVAAWLSGYGEPGGILSVPADPGR